jgi:hypothetical protein
MLFAVRPLLGMLHRRLLAKKLVDSPYYMCLVMLLLIAAAFTTQGLGIHCFFGAFVMGLVTPKEGAFAENIADRMELVTGGKNMCSITYVPHGLWQDICFMHNLVLVLHVLNSTGEHVYQPPSCSLLLLLPLLLLCLQPSCCCRSSLRPAASKQTSAHSTPGDIGALCCV